ncbi:MAG: altronate dehydratase family protein [Clostridium tyrobutyricum]|nr:altronate dehydratase family protein [Clostridium tyrobutyricum]MEA5009816.1 altronate dehydratase family protein [Clostridium tyrobutyricum]
MYHILSINDSVAVALRDLAKGSKFETPKGEIVLKEEIQRGHKFALQDIPKGTNVIKYGFPIGHAFKDISKGEWVHTHNTKTNLSDTLTYKYNPMPEANHIPIDKRTFMGYKRANGKVGIRNDLYIIPMVSCVNALLDIVLQQFKALYPDNGYFDNIIILKHPYGCNQLGDDFDNTRNLLIDAVLHPNAGGVLLFGLGCETNQMSEFLDTLEKVGGPIDKTRIKHLVAQEVDDEYENALNMLQELNETASHDRRTPQPLSKLCIGLKCGGSDGLSGITANPLLGHVTDFITAQGGTSVLTEVPEMFGAETILMSHAADEATFNKIVDLINNFKDYFIKNDQPVYENPAPGNYAGGITTLEDKSLGCTQKAGRSYVTDVLKYAERVKKPGLSLLEAPGNDPVCVSAEAAAGCQMILFTTGRGNPFSSFVPTIKVSSNSPLAKKKPRWIDFDAGKLLETPMEELTDIFIQKLLDVASGEKTNNEKYNINGFTMFKTGVTV